MAEDLNWISLENKARKLIKELVEPTVRRAIEDREQLTKLSHLVEHNSTKMGEFEFALHKIHKKLAIIDDVNKRQTDLEAVQRALDNRLLQQNQTLKGDMEALSLDIQHKADTIKTFEKQLEYSASQLRAFSDSLLKIRSEMQADIETVQAKAITAAEQSKAAVADLTEVVSALETQQSRVNVQLGDNSAEVTAHTKLLAALRTKTDKFELEKAPTSSFLDLKKELEKLHLKMLGDKENVERRLKLLKDGLAMQGPYPQQLLVAECLHEVLDVKTRRKLAQVEADKYQNWLSLETLHYDLRPVIEQALEKALAVQEELKETERSTSRDMDERGKSRGKRDSEEVSDTVYALAPRPAKASHDSFSRSRHSESDRSVSPDEVPRPREDQNPTPQFRPSRRPSAMRPRPPSQENSSAYQRKPHAEAGKVEEPRAETAKSSVFSAQEQEFVAFYTDSGESAHEEPAAFEELQLQLDELAQRLNTEVAVIRDELVTKHNEMTKFVKENVELCESLSKQVFAESANLNNQRKRDKTDVMSELTELQEAQKALRTESLQSTAVLERFAQLCTHLIECTRIGIALALQDEDDRQSIALMGYKENTRLQSRPNSALKAPILSLDKQCLSCTNQASIVISAFKIACLAYTPTPIFYRKSTFSRKDLLEIQSRVLEAAWDEVATSEPWISLKLRDTAEVLPKSIHSSMMQRTFLDTEEMEDKRAMTAAPPDRLPLLLSSKPGSVATTRRK